MGSGSDSPNEVIRIDDVFSADELLKWPSQEPPDDCLHNYLTATILDGEIIGQNCMMCWLPVGVPCEPEEAKHNERVALEIHAATVAYHFLYDDILPDPYGEIAQGMQDNLTGVDMRNDIWDEHLWLVGWLAAEIVNNDEDDSE